MSTLAVLLIENDPIDVRSVERAIKKLSLDVQVQWAGHGRAAMELLQRAYGRRESGDAWFPRPDLILLDINMPIMNGFEFLSAVKSDRDFRSIPVVVMTTSKEIEDMRKSYDCGAAGYIIKPVEFDAFVSSMKIIADYWILSGRLTKGDRHDH